MPMKPTTTSSVPACRHSVDSIQAERYDLIGAASTNSSSMRPTTVFQMLTVAYLITLACFIVTPTNFFSALLLLLSVPMGVLSVTCLKKSLSSTVSVKQSRTSGLSPFGGSGSPLRQTCLVWNNRTGTMCCLNCLKQWTPPSETDISLQNGKNSLQPEKPFVSRPTLTTLGTYVSPSVMKALRQNTFTEKTPTEPRN